MGSTGARAGNVPNARRSYSGPAILQQGFRPFFLAAGIWATLAMVLWLAMLWGALDLPSAFPARTWHAHEMLFGFVAAAAAGFVLTAIPNWTGRLPVRGPQLGLLLALWLAGRIAVSLSLIIGPLVAAAVDLLFPLALLVTVVREIAVGRNWRNLPIAAVLGLLLAANLLMHLEATGAAATSALGQRLAVADVAMLIALMGGRIIPSFTRNWLAKRGAARLPSPFGSLDRLALLAVASAGVFWTLSPGSAATGVLAALAAVTSALRLARWRGLGTLSEPLLWILHLGYAWMVVGFALLSLSILGDTVSIGDAVHGLTAGAFGTMILAVMTRVTLGHTGRPLRAGRGTTACFLLLTGAVAARLAAPLAGPAAFTLLWLSALGWVLAFGLFVVLYLARPRPPAA